MAFTYRMLFNGEWRALLCDLNSPGETVRPAPRYRPFPVERRDSALSRLPGNCYQNQASPLFLCHQRQATFQHSNREDAPIGHSTCQHIAFLFASTPYTIACDILSTSDATSPYNAVSIYVGADRSRVSPRRRRAGAGRAGPGRGGGADRQPQPPPPPRHGPRVSYTASRRQLTTDALRSTGRVR